MPDHAAHADHDPVLIAAHAAGDATGADLARAAELVATCPECASLHRDLRALSAAMAATPAPSRPRDFRIDASQAAALRRPTGWRRVLAPFAGARSSAGPLAASLATLGIAGLLLSGGFGSGLGFGLGGSSAAATAAPAALQAPANDGGTYDLGSGGTNTAGGAEAAPPAAGAAVPSAAASVAPSAAPLAAASAAASFASGPPDIAGEGSAVSAPTAAASSTDKRVSTARPPTPAYAGASAGPTSAPQAVVAPTSRDSATAPPSGPHAVSETGSGPSPVVVGSLVLLLAGIVLGVLRLAARRLV